MSGKRVNYWTGIFGNVKRLALLDRFLASDSLPHSYIFVGRGGIGKKQVALAMARRLLCRCDSRGECVSCRATVVENLPGIYYLDGESQILVEQIREIRQELYRTDILAGWRVVLVENAQKLTVPAANAILKVLEEPAKKIVFIFILTNLKKLIPTVTSRSVVIYFDRLSSQEESQWQLSVSELSVQQEEEVSWPYLGVPGVTEKLRSQSLAVHEKNVLGFWNLARADYFVQLPVIKRMAAMEKKKILGLMTFWESCLRDYFLWHEGVNEARWWRGSAIEQNYQLVNMEIGKILAALAELSHLRQNLIYNWSSRIQLTNWFIGLK
jgi:hypothetical protein